MDDPLVRTVGIVIKHSQYPKLLYNDNSEVKHNYIMHSWNGRQPVIQFNTK